MTFTEDLRNIEDVDPSFIAIGVEETDVFDEENREMGRGRARRRLRRAARRVAPDRSVLTSGLAMSAACVGGLVIASTLHRGSPWAGLNAVTSGFGLVGRRAPTRFDARLTAISLGAIVGSSMLIAAIANKVTPARGIGRIGGGLLAAGGSYAMDRFVMKPSLIPALRHSVGPIGLALQYGFLGLGAILGRRTR